MFARVNVRPANVPSILGGLTARHANCTTSEFHYRKGTEIYGEKEPAEYVYQVVSGAVRSYKLLSDGRRQIGAFHLVGDIFGLGHAEEHMLLLGRKTALERVAAFLLEMDRRLTGVGVVALPMCRRDIADYLGLTLETVSRALSKLHAYGALNFLGSNQREIMLVDRDQLSRLDN